MGASESLNYILPYIDKGKVIPIISNSFRLEEIFLEADDLLRQLQLAEQPEFYDEIRTIDQQLTKTWAKEIGYPMSDDHNLARVAQYRQVEVEAEDPDRVKMEYLEFIIRRLLKISEKRDGYETKVSELRRDLQMQKLTFSNAVRELDYPHFPDGVEDPLRLLAKLPLPIYITTSYSTFLERELEREGVDKKPRTQICFWNGGTSNFKPEHLPDPKFDPTPQTPAVYHLFGLEDYNETLVLSEDDYMNFLMNAVEEINSQDLYPSPLRLALPDARLILLGYNLRDWDFRALFRFLLRIRKAAKVRPNMVIQLKPDLGKKEYEERSLKYLEQYFEERNFKVQWANAEKFVYDLWKAYSNRQG